VQGAAVIGVSSSNKSFRVLARYLAQERNVEEQKRVAWSTSRNLPTDDADLAARIMRATAAQNVRVKDPVYHLALSFDPGDAVDRAAMERVADRVLEVLHLQEHQVLIVAHADREHAHMHLMVNRVHPETGKAWSRWQDYPAIRRVLREEEEALGLRRLPGRSPERPSTERDLMHRLADDLRTYERLVEIGRGRYSAEMELSAAEARLAQLDAAAERAKKALEALRESLRAVYRDPDRALISFLSAGAREPPNAVRDMRERPERFGELLTAAGRERSGRRRGDDAAAREAARTAAGVGRELVDAEKAFRIAVGHARNGRRREAGTPAVDGADQEADTRAGVRADIEGIQMRLRQLRDEEQRAPDFHLLERALARGLWELSPPEFNRLREVVTGAQFSLAGKLRHLAEDVLLGRDPEM
jgi:MobA/VirD2-like, nuclease domain